jgi:flagellar biosynthesis protein FliR
VLLVSGLGGRVVPQSIRTALLLVLAATTTPAGAAPDGMALVAAGVSQIVVGLAAALPLLLVIEATRGAGGMVDWAAGRGAVTGQESSSSFATIYGLAVIATWSAVGGPLVAIRAHHAGIERFGLGEALTLGGIAPLTEVAISATGSAFALCVALGLPVLGAALAVDLAMGWVGRALPSLQVSFASMPLRLLVALSVVAAGLGAAVATAVDALGVAAATGGLP